MNLTEPNKAIVIDGHSLAYRAYFSTISQQKFLEEKNLPNYATVRMMIIMISKLLSRESYNYGLIAFDTSRKSFRTEQFEDYKSNRPSMPENLIKQMPLIINALKLFGFQIISIENIEADDIIASFSKICSNQKIDCHVFSSDRDLLQLVNEYTSIHILKKGVSDILIYNHKNFSELTDGLIPKQIIDLKALTGDSSDNYKGVDGIGSKTALKLIINHYSLENIYQKLNEISKNIAEKLIKNKKNAFLFLKIAKTLDDILPEKNILDFTLSNIKLKDVQDFLVKLNLEGLLKYYQLK